MKRRDFLVVLGTGLIGAPLRSFAQQPPRMIRIGFLGGASGSDPNFAGRVEGLRKGLRDLGYVEGRDVVIEFRWASGNYGRLADLAAELIRLNVDLVVTQGTPAARAAKRATSTVPIVMASVGDPVAAGLVSSLARPGGNITGLTFFVPELSAKRLELLKEAVPSVAQAAFLSNPDNASSGPSLQAMRISARQIKIDLQHFEVRGPGELEGIFSAMAKRRVDSVVVGNDGMLIANARAIAVQAARLRIPSSGPNEFAKAGGLIGYDVNQPEQYRRAAAYVDKIVKGARPGDLSIERPTRFEMLLNRKTAKMLGLAIPQHLLLRADGVIE
jgi:putative ABC transport system substrate-binding protein